MYGDRVNTNFQGKKVPKENASYKCLSLIMLDSVIGVNKKYYPKHYGKSVNMLEERIKWKTLLIMI